MCFNVHPNSDYKNPLVAEEDIKCYKMYNVIRGKEGLSSPFQHHEVEVGKTYTLPEPPKPGDRPVDSSGIGYPWQINKGFHSYMPTLKLKESTLRCIAQRMDIEILDRYDVFAECTIPKGTVYYINPEDNENVSQSITINRVIPMDMYKHEKYTVSSETVTLGELANQSNNL